MTVQLAGGYVLWLGDMCCEPLMLSLRSLLSAAGTLQQACTPRNGLMQSFSCHLCCVSANFLVSLLSAVVHSVGLQAF